MLKNRVLPAILIGAVTIACVLICVETRVLFFMVLGVMSAWEMRSIFKNIDTPVSFWIPAVTIIIQGLLCYFCADTAWMVALLGAAAFAAMLWGILCAEKVGGVGAMATLGCLLWPVAFYAVILYVCTTRVWLGSMAIGILGVWACDSAALSGGHYWGKKKVAPLVSPHKTWAGCYTGAAASLLAGIIIYFLLKSFGGPTLWVCMVTCLIASTAGQIGDLAASLIKRMCGVKDYSQLIPVHGGIMDKTDSMLFAIPVAYLCLRIFGAA